MRLSEAIRLGAMLKPQAFGADRLLGGTCAIGAAIEATGEYVMGSEYERFPIMVRFHDLRCPACSPCSWPSPGSLWLTVTHLNDAHRWTREQIADFVESLEAAQEIGPPETEDAVRLSVEQPSVPLRASV